MPLVEIVGPADNWILEKQAKQLVAKLPYATFSIWKPSGSPSIRLVYYVNYALFQRKSETLDVGFFTHYDEEQQFLERAQMMDHAVCMSKQYADWLRGKGVETVTHIPIGFDFYRYRPRLIVGVVGLLEHPRKGKHLVELVEQLDFVELKRTEGQLSETELLEFYESLDFVLIPATVEGGPMSLLESLAMGTPVIAPDTVGMVPEFPDSNLIRRYPTGDGTALIELMRSCFREKSAGKNLVNNRTLDHWAEAHHTLFRNLLLNRGEPFPEPASGFRFGMMRELDLPPSDNAAGIETIIDTAAKHLYFGEYADARAVLQVGAALAPSLRQLLTKIPSSVSCIQIPEAPTSHQILEPVEGRIPPENCPVSTVDGPKVLVIAHVGTLRDRMDKSHYLRYQALCQRPGFTLFGPGLAGYRHGMSLEHAIDVACGGVYPDIVIHGGDLRDSGTPLVTGLEEARCPTAIELLDTWANPDRTLQFVRKFHFDIGLMQEASFHLDFFRQHCPETQFFWTPNGVDTNLFRDYGLPKIYDVIFYGVIEPNIYPFRSRLLRLLATEPSLRVKIIEHPGYYPNATPTSVPIVSGSQLSMEINQSWIGIATRSIYNCFLMKYLEIPISGAVVAGNVPDSGRDALRGCMIELSEDMSDATIVSTIQEYLRDKNRLKRMMTVSSNRISRDFSTEAFAGRVTEICHQVAGWRKS